MSLPRCSILEVTPKHRDWPEYVAAINGDGQERWAFDVHFEPFPRHFVMAKQDGHVVGFLMYVVWEIGPNDRSHRPLVVNGRALTEAKIIAFGVKQAYRRQGIGRALQEHTLRRAKALGCYQVRSVSDGDHPENHQLKPNRLPPRSNIKSSGDLTTFHHWLSPYRGLPLGWLLRARTSRQYRPRWR